MKKTVPFQKDITFDTNIAVINSISLEHEITDQKDDKIAGKFIVSGNYKMTENSSNLDTFEYSLPFSINIDNKYNIDDAIIDISDFYYEVLNNKVLSVNIELSIDRVAYNEEKEETMPKEIEEVVEPKERCVEEESDTKENKSIFDSLSDSEEYVTYKVHIVSENDTIEAILNKYDVAKEELDKYNDLSELKPLDKIIVPNENK